MRQYLRRNVVYKFRILIKIFKENKFLQIHSLFNITMLRIIKICYKLILNSEFCVCNINKRALLQIMAVNVRFSKKKPKNLRVF